MIVIVAGVGVGFPDGMAATARVTSYARGLIASGNDVLVLCLGASEASVEGAANTQVRGISDGVRFEYTCGSTVRRGSFWQRRRSRLAGLVGAARRIGGEQRRGQVEAILLYSQRTLDAFVLRLVSDKVGAVYIADVSEIPYQSHRPGLYERLRLVVYERVFYRWFDAAVVISEPLRRRAIRLGRPGIAVCKAPVMVDTDELRPTLAASRPRRKVVMYTGTLDQEKDGVGDLVRAFRMVAPEVSESHLMLVGDAPWGTRVREFRALAEKLGIADRVTLTGRVARKDLPSYLAQASVLVLARPRSLQADAGMPTKVAEYLASGVPTVLSRTGDIVDFLEDGVNAYLVPPGSVPALAEMVRHVLLNSAEGESVGRRGREVALEHFDYRVVGASVSAFIAHVIESRHKRGVAGVPRRGSEGEERP